MNKKQGNRAWKKNGQETGGNGADLMVSAAEIKKLVLVRLEAMPPNVSVSIGSKDLPRDKLLQ